MVSLRYNLAIDSRTLPKSCISLYRPTVLNVFSDYKDSKRVRGSMLKVLKNNLKEKIVELKIQVQVHKQKKHLIGSFR